VTANRAIHGFNLILDATTIDASVYDTGGFLSKVGAL
jgi:hypothetical protein